MFAMTTALAETFAQKHKEDEKRRAEAASQPQKPQPDQNTKIKIKKKSYTEDMPLRVSAPPVIVVVDHKRKRTLTQYGTCDCSFPDYHSTVQIFGRLADVVAEVRDRSWSHVNGVLLKAAQDKAYLKTNFSSITTMLLEYQNKLKDMQRLETEARACLDILAVKEERDYCFEVPDPYSPSLEKDLDSTVSIPHQQALQMARDYSHNIHRYDPKLLTTLLNESKDNNSNTSLKK